MADISERRRKLRRTTQSPAWADPGGILPVIDCRILDFSEDGARIAAPLDIELPPVFDLQIDRSRILGSAEVVWRKENEVGVRFLRRF